MSNCRIYIWNRVLASAIFESNFPVTYNQCDESITDEGAVLRSLSLLWWISGREECKTSSSEIQKKQVKHSEIYSIVALE